MATPSATSIALMVLLLVVPAVLAADYPISWSQGTSYDDWDSDKTLVAGDTITFTYGPSHSVNVVDKGTYDSCGSASKDSLTGGSNKVPLVAGNMYFLCPQGNHCATGMKLSVKVSAAATPTTPSTPTTPGTPATPATPATPTPGTPAAKPTAPSGTNAATSSYNMNFIVIGGSLLLAPLFAFLG